MTKNEIRFIEDWIKYHGYLIGFENIHIIDGSDDQTNAHLVLRTTTPSQVSSGGLILYFSHKCR